MTMSQVPVKALGKEAKDLLSSLLNPEKIFFADNKLSRDWRGLAELCGISGELMPSFQRCGDPTKKILKTWSEKNKSESTIDKLFSFLETLDRYDVLDDVTPYVEKDIQYFNSNSKAVCAVDSVDSDDEDILTYDDAKRKMQGQPPQIYDGFVLFDDEDIDFATNIVNTLEGQYNMKLCVKDRDLVGGRLEHFSVIKLISMRCRKVIVVVSPSFWDSPTNKYFYSLAQLDNLEKRCTKIIPCMDKPCVVPIEFRVYHTLIFTRSEKLFGNFWDQLCQAIKRVPVSSSVDKTHPVQVERTTTTTTPMKRIPNTTKTVNHVKFINNIDDDAAETRQEDTKSLNKEENTPANSMSDVPLMDLSEERPAEVLRDLKKSTSFYKRFKKIINPKTKKQDVGKEMSNVVKGVQQKKKKNLKSSKVKVAITN